jgi:hypothetical protein
MSLLKWLPLLVPYPCNESCPSSAFGACCPALRLSPFFQCLLTAACCYLSHVAFAIWVAMLPHVSHMPITGLSMGFKDPWHGAPAGTCRSRSAFLLSLEFLSSGIELLSLHFLRHGSRALLRMSHSP